MPEKAKTYALTEISREICELLAAALPEVDFCLEAAERELFDPLQKPLVCIGFQKLAVREAAAGCLTAEGRFGFSADITLQLALFCGGENPLACLDLLSDLCAALLETGAGMAALTCGESVWLPKQDCRCLKAELKLRRLLEQAIQKGGHLDGTADSAVGTADQN